MAWKLSSWINRITGNTVAAADINDIVESIYAIVGNGTAAPTKTMTQIIADAVTPKGVVSPYAGITAPSGWLLCDGSSYLRSSYTDLVSAIIVSIGTCTISIASPGVVTLNTHGLITGDRIHLTTTGALPTGLSASTDYWVIYNDANTFWLATSLSNAVSGTKIATSGSQSGTHTFYRSPHGIADATHFNVPDMREASPVGTGTRGIGVTTHDIYANGQFKDDQFEEHYHYIQNSAKTVQLGAAGVASGSLTGFVAESGSDLLTATAAKSGALSVTPRTGTTTRGKSIGLNYIIKY